MGSWPLPRRWGRESASHGCGEAKIDHALKESAAVSAPVRHLVDHFRNSLCKIFALVWLRLSTERPGAAFQQEDVAPNAPQASFLHRARKRIRVIVVQNDAGAQFWRSDGLYSPKPISTHHMMRKIYWLGQVRDMSSGGATPSGNGQT
jgi:hypothetical protein